ncbi:hypothetical protein [Rhodococcus artemisiae]|uniref:Uncharacterized protein n=1 Tax=Rhodococcus artemisiae TaxID=714159 RepID=A0ABU7LBP9_9NOCA|nr:hypothetical protein [Rhodococcus artemisiae]MEE2058945.1 hypothetical protein [Rhodococcus artemisiae]
MNIEEELGKEIVIARDGLTIGGRKFPGVIAREQMTVEPPSGNDPLWFVKLTLITETPPRFIGTKLAESGEIVIEDGVE